MSRDTGRLAQLSREELESLLADLNELRIADARLAEDRKRLRDAERHMDVHCPRCGARERTRCLDATKRIDESHPERAWKTCECPACGAVPGEWCLSLPALAAGGRVPCHSRPRGEGAARQSRDSSPSNQRGDTGSDGVRLGSAPRNTA